MQATTAKAEYARWLMSELGVEFDSYLFLAMCLNSIEFYYSIPDDKNRTGDARTIRNEYVEKYGEDILDDLPTASTVLEVLVTLALKANWTICSSPYRWFMIFIENLGLDFLTDQEWSSDGESFAVSTIHRWLDRKFSPNGSGSPFRSSKHDLTETSIWDSMQWYLADEFGEGQL